MVNTLSADDDAGLRDLMFRSRAFQESINEQLILMAEARLYLLGHHSYALMAECFDRLKKTLPPDDELLIHIQHHINNIAGLGPTDMSPEDAYRAVAALGEKFKQAQDSA